LDEREAEQVIGALERGRQFEFSNYHAGEREVLAHEAAAGRFVHTTHYAYESGRDERRLFTRDGFAAHLREHFSYQSFDLPAAAAAPRKIAAAVKQKLRLCARRPSRPPPTLSPASANTPRPDPRIDAGDDPAH
jgi:hypothetical protein